MDNSDEPLPINASPTKNFFVDMLVRDIPLEQAVLDLVDNSVDGAKKARQAEGSDLDGFIIEIQIETDYFRIYDNCGGFSTQMAREYAFRFGRPAGSPVLPHSIGQFGVGMKRALFKFGRRFVVRSATSKEQWAVRVDVSEWEADDADWSFAWADFTATLGESAELSEQFPGTEIFVKSLRPEVAVRFATKSFVNSIKEFIKSKHRQFISTGLEIRVNAERLSATNLSVLMNESLQPGFDSFVLGNSGEAPVNVTITVGIGVSAPREAGWYVVCNGRVVLEADRRSDTGWGLIEDGSGQSAIPGYHNQFARFRGIVTFDCQNSSRVPWNTTKTDVDKDSPIWSQTFQRMLEMMRPVIDFLNSLDRDIDEYTRDRSPLLAAINRAVPQNVETIQIKSDFSAPLRGAGGPLVRHIKIQYSKNVEDIEFLQEALGVNTAKAVGEKSFDLALQEQKG